MLVTLGLDASAFTKGQAQTSAALKGTAEATDKTSAGMQLSAKHITEAFSRVRNEILGLFALVSAGRGIKALTEDITTSDAATGRLAASLGMATEDLAEWQSAAERSGGSAAGITGSIQALSGEFEKFKALGQMDEGMQNWFNRLGISLHDVNTGKWKTVTELYRELADKMSGLSPQRATLVGNAFHMDLGTVNTLRQGLAMVDQLRANAAKLGVPTDSDAKHAQQLINDVKDLRQAFEGLFRVILNDVSPAIDAMTKRLIAWIEANGPRIRAEVTDRIQEAFAFLSAHWGDIENGANAAYNAIKTLVDTFASLSPAMQHAIEIMGGLWLTGMLGPIATVAAALAGVGSTLAGISGTLIGLPALAAIAGAGVVAAMVADPGHLQAQIDQKVPILGALDDWWAKHIGGFGALSAEQQKQLADGLPVDGSNAAQQDSFIGKFVRALATARALSLINPDGTVSGSFGLGDYGSVATPGEMARVRGLHAGPGQAELDTPETQRREKQAFDFFKGQGWTAEQAAGIVANIRKESGFREGAIGDGGTAFGIGQWHPDRQAALRAAGYNLTTADFPRQLEAFQFEITQGHEMEGGALLRAAKTAAEAGGIVSRYVERPKDVESEAADRGGIAERVLRRQTTPPSGAVPGPEAPTGAPFIVGNAAAPRPAPSVAPLVMGSAQQRWGRQVANNTTNDNRSETNINGPITIHTQATDARGVAAGLRDRIASLTFATQMNRGLV